MQEESCSRFSAGSHIRFLAQVLHKWTAGFFKMYSCRGKPGERKLLRVKYTSHFSTDPTRITDTFFKSRVKYFRHISER